MSWFDPVWLTGHENPTTNHLFSFLQCMDKSSFSQTTWHRGSIIGEDCAGWFCNEVQEWAAGLPGCLQCRSLGSVGATHTAAWLQCCQVMENNSSVVVSKRVHVVMCVGVRGVCVCVCVCVWGGGVYVCVCKEVVSVCVCVCRGGVCACVWVRVCLSVVCELLL